MDKNIFIFAGETSADLYAAMLLVELKLQRPEYHFWGVGGPSSKGLMECIIPMKKFQVMGISDVLKALPRLVSSFYTVKREILKRLPEMVLIIDQPSFGIKLAKALRKKGYKGKIVQFVAPTVWAWKPERADLMADYFDLLLTLFDFEVRYFTHTKLKTVFVGHPIVQLIEQDKTQTLSLDPDRPILSIFPGSRPAEIKRNLAKQLEAAQSYCKKHPTTQLAVSCGQDMHELLPNGITVVPFNARYELMRRSHLALAKSGTVTLELALHKVPTVVTYELSFLNHLMAKYVMKISKMAHFSIVNILANSELFFERIRPPVTVEDIAACLEAYEEDPKRYQECQNACDELKKHVRTDKSPIKNAVEAICELL